MGIVLVREGVVGSVPVLRVIRRSGGRRAAPLIFFCRNVAGRGRENLRPKCTLTDGNVQIVVPSTCHRNRHGRRTCTNRPTTRF